MTPNDCWLFLTVLASVPQVVGWWGARVGNFDKSLDLFGGSGVGDME